MAKTQPSGSYPGGVKTSKVDAGKEPYKSKNPKIPTVGQSGKKDPKKKVKC